MQADDIKRILDEMEAKSMTTHHLIERILHRRRIETLKWQITLLILLAALCGTLTYFLWRV